MGNVNILKPPMPNLPGLNSVYYALVEDVVSLPLLINNNGYVGSLTMAAGKTFYKLYLTRGTVNFEEPMSQTPFGDVFDRKLTGITPKDRPQTAAQLAKIRKVILIYKDNNGFYKIIGTLEEPMRLTYKLSTGQPGGEGNRYEVSFGGVGKNPAYFYFDNIPLAGDSGGSGGIVSSSVNILGPDLSVLETLAGGSNETTRHIISLLTGAQILTDLNSVGDPQKTIVRDGLSPVWQITVSFNNSHENLVRYRFGENTKITGISTLSGSYSGVVFYKNSVLMTGALPYTYSIDDEMRVEFTGLAVGLNQFKIGGNFIDDILTQTNTNKINEVYLFGYGGVSVYQPDIDRMVKSYSIPTAFSPDYFFRDGRNLYPHPQFKWNGFNANINLDSGASLTQVAIQTYLLRAILAYGGKFYIPSYGNINIFYLRIFNPATGTSSNGANANSASNGGGKWPQPICVYGSKILCGFDNNYIAFYDPTANSWSGYKAIKGVGIDLYAAHTDIANSFIYYMGETTTGSFDVYKLDLSTMAETLYLSCGYLSGASYIIFDGDRAIILLINSTTADCTLRVRKIATNTEIANINTAEVGSVAANMIYDKERQLVYLSNGYSNYLKVFDMTTYTLKSRKLIGVSMNNPALLSDWDNPKIYY